MNKENRPPADLLPTTEENPAPPSATGPAVWEHQFIANFGTLASMGPHPSGDENVECHAVRIDASAFKGGKAQMQSHVVRAGEFASSLVTRYSANSGVSFADLCSVGLGSADTIRPRNGTAVAIPDAAAVSDLLLKVVRRGGNGVLTPAVWNALIRLSSLTRGGGGGTPSDLPEGAWGTVIWDLNAALLSSRYANGAEVNLWPDSSPTGYDAVTNGGAVVNAPVYLSAGFPGSLPCVSTSGLNLPLRANNPTLPLGSWTYYFVLAQLDGGDVGYILNGENGYPFGFDFWITSNQVCAQVHTNAFGSTTDCETDTGWNMLAKHIYRWVKDSGSVHWRLFRDGTEVADNTANPQSSDTTILSLLNAAGGLGMTAKAGRMVAYNQPHMNPVAGNSTPANGLTAPEIALKAYWGTP